MKYQTLISVFVFLSTYMYAQPANFQWVKTMGGGMDESGKAITTDFFENVYTVGRFMYQGDYDPGVGTYSLNAQVGDNVFISKLDEQGNFVWAKQILGSIGTAFVHGNAITTDKSGFVYIAGKFMGTVDFDPGVATYTVAGGYFDAFILKLDPAGNFVWLQTFASGNYAASFNAIKTDAGGNIYATGDAAGEIFVCKLDNAGSYIWTKQLPGAANNTGQSIAVGSGGDVYVTGIFENTVDFDPDVPVFNLTATGLLDVFILKLTTSGNFTWAKQIGGTLDDWGMGLALDPTENVYITGQYSSFVDFDPDANSSFPVSPYGIVDNFILKLDASGAFGWVKHMGGISAATHGNAIGLDSIGNIYTTGGFFGTINSFSGNALYPLFADTYFDAFITKSDPAGNFIWVKQLGGSRHDYGNSIAIEPNGTIYTTGFFNAKVDFDPGQDTLFVTVPSYTGSGSYFDQDVFVHKMITCYPNQSLNAVSNVTMICNGSSAILTASGAASYMWNTGEVTSSVIVNPTVTTVYKVTGTDSNGCEEEFLITQMVSTCMGMTENPGEKHQLSLFPNPNSGDFVVVGDMFSGDFQYELISSDGTVMESGSKATTVFNFSGRGYSSGLYFLKIKTGTGYSTVKFVLE